jgi:membrane-associated phospholipid phosphatase
MKNHKERIIPYFITFLLLYIAHVIIKKLPLDYFYSTYLFAASISVLLVIIISYFWKISTHMVGIGGFTGLILSLSLRMTANLLGILIIAIIVAGILGTSRLKLNAHNPSQVYMGYILGFFTIVFFCLFF